MRKGIKTRATVIGAKSAFAQTTKRQAGSDHLRDDIVHANAPRAHFGENSMEKRKAESGKRKMKMPMRCSKNSARTLKRV